MATMYSCDQYVTCFDSNFVPQGIALYKSLCKQSKSFCLWVICLDRETKETIEKWGFSNLRPLLLEDLETPELLAVKKARSKAEYIWTLSPYFPEWIFRQDGNIQRVTFLDADMFFFSDPAPIFNELNESGKAVLITEHAFDKEYDNSSLLGRFCVQFISYNRSGSEEVIEWWRKKCLEWCFARAEDGKFGDQKYLDSWPELFHDKVHVLSNFNFILAPWNSGRYSAKELIAWHFHGFRLLEGRRILLHSMYRIPTIIDKEVYGKYIEELLPIISSDLIPSQRFFKYNKIKKGLLFSLGRARKIVTEMRVRSIDPRIKIVKY